MENSGVYNISPAELSQKHDLIAGFLTKAKQGNEAAFTELYNFYFEKIFRFIYYRVGHKEAAEDLCEEVFIKVFRKISSLDNNSSFEGWLYQIARNGVIDHYRDKKQTIPLEEVENTLEYENNVLDLLKLDEHQKILLKLLKQLKPDQQAVLKLKFLEDLENPEIARILNKSEGAIRVIQHRALLALQKLTKQDPQYSQFL
jgi:RNA polymerase sigma-70 factor (ECF subfamily)